MCGINGIYNLNEAPVSLASLIKMNHSIRHRGPDDEGFTLINTQKNKTLGYSSGDTVAELRSLLPSLPAVTDSNLAFGFRRLSIIDLSSDGHQPMHDPETGNCCMFNGEIYNYIELRRELQAAGYAFRTSSDTEVLLRAYHHWGTDFLSRLNGMFGFSIWDANKRELFCARDRLGIKPFHYYFNGHSFIWSSEIKAILASGLVPAEANNDVIANFLLHSRYDTDEQTFFRRILQLLPGHALRISASTGLKMYRYWDIQPGNCDLSPQAMTRTFYELFYDSVRLQMRSDVPVGIALSGGLDSGSIAMVAEKLTGNSINTFSVYYENNRRYDEREFIREILASGKFNPVFFSSDGNFPVDLIQRWIYFQDAPTVSASPFSAYHNYQNIQTAGVKVVLNGQGGDELLAGYPYFFKYFFLSLLKNRQYKNLLAELNFYRSKQKISLHAFGRLLMMLTLRSYLPSSLMHQFEIHDKVNSKYYDKSLLSVKSPEGSGIKFSDPFTQSLYSALTSTILPRLLHWEDRNSMAFSIESRVPFLDHRLVEFVFQLPGQMKINDAETKSVLRESMRGVLPEKVRTRQDKTGFATPTDEWTKDRLKPVILDMLHSRVFRERGIYNTTALLHDFDKNSGQFKNSEIWKIFTLELWFRNFMDAPVGNLD